MVEYKDNSHDVNICTFIGKLVTLTENNNLEWKKIRTDVPIYLSSVINIDGKEYYATAKHDGIRLTLDIDASKFALENNANKISQLHIMMRITGVNADYAITKLLADLLNAIETQIKYIENTKLMVEKIAINKLIQNFIKEEDDNMSNINPFVDDKDAFSDTKKRKNYVWSAEIELNENGKFDVWLGEENASGACYKNKTAEEIGEILTQDIKAVFEE